MASTTMGLCVWLQVDTSLVMFPPSTLAEGLEGPCYKNRPPRTRHFRGRAAGGGTLEANPLELFERKARGAAVSAVPTPALIS